MREIPLTQGKVALVDDEDYERVAVFSWQARHPAGKRTWYATRSRWDCDAKRNRHVAMHRYIVGAPDDRQVDHVNLDGLDNRRANLRLCFNSGNSANRSLSRANTSGFKGVSLHTRLLRWIVNINVDGKKTYLGLYDDKIEAALVYDRAARRYYGDFARLNFPGMVR